MLSVGIIGLPNVGKSTLFNSLTSGDANVSNYPFTTIDSNIGVVAVPDGRLAKLEELLKPEETTPSFIQFIDIAGLVRGASRGEGLGNQFLGNIRQVDAIVHVVRCFQDEDIAHVLGEIDAARDIDVVETELLLADMELMDRAIEKRIRNWRTSPRQYANEEKRYTSYRENLAAGIPLRRIASDEESKREMKALGLLTGKPILYLANVSEEDFLSGAEVHVTRIKQSRISYQPTVIPISADLEWQLLQLEADERLEFMEAMGLERSGLDRLIRTAYEMLDLLTFFTVANNKLQAWAIKNGTKAPQAAGKIHSDMEKGFVRAQVVSFDKLYEHGSIQSLHKLGLVRTEGKDYVVQEGDVIEIAFSG